MSVEWAVAIVGIAVTVLTIILGWMGTALWGIRGDLREFVTRSECIGKMSEHCSDITELRYIAKENQKKIAKLEMIAQTEHHLKIGD